MPAEWYTGKGHAGALLSNGCEWRRCNGNPRLCLNLSDSHTPFLIFRWWWGGWWINLAISGSKTRLPRLPTVNLYVEPIWRVKQLRHMQSCVSHAPTDGTELECSVCQVQDYSSLKQLNNRNFDVFPVTCAVRLPVPVRLFKQGIDGTFGIMGTLILRALNLLGSASVYDDMPCS